MTIFACLILAAGLMYYIFSPPANVETPPEKTRLSFLRERKDMVYENLRDLNFEYKAGKFPENDYATMRTALEDEAAAILAEIDRLESTVGVAS